MNRKLLILTIAAADLLCGCAAALPGEEAPHLESDTARMARTIAVLASDSLGGRRAGSGDDLRAARYLEEELRAAGCEALWPQMAVPVDLSEVSEGRRYPLAGPWNRETLNLAAIIRSDRPEADKVLLGAHYDHVGSYRYDVEMPRIGLYIPAGELLRGANDNASGTAAVVELARLLRPYRDRFRRDLVVALFGAEELGLVGSRRMERMLRDSMIRVGHMVNLEMLGRMRGDTLLVEGGRIADLGPLVARTPKSDTTLRVAADPEQMSMGSDHASFAKRMIPVSFFVTTDHSTLHRPTDTPESLDMEGMKRAVDYIAAYLYELLTAETLPPLVIDRRATEERATEVP